jgi:hypothetical protein
MNKNNCLISSRCTLFDFGKIKLEFLANFKYQPPVKFIEILSKQTRFFKNPKKILNIKALQQQLIQDWVERLNLSLHCTSSQLSVSNKP